MTSREVNKTIPRKQGGFIALIIFLIIALALLKYLFDWSIFEATSSPQGQETVGYTRQVIDFIWSLIKTPALWIWNNILWPILGVVWGFFLDFVSWSNENRAK